MRRFSNPTIWFTTFLLLIIAMCMIAIGCADPDEGTPSPNLIAATIISVSPADGTAAACPDGILTATFDQAMNGATINPGTFTLAGPAGAVPGQVSYDSASHTASFAPTTSLALDTFYTATITTGVASAWGIHPTHRFVWSFTTGPAPCFGGAPPDVVSVTPADGVCPDTAVTATFSTAMNPATINAATFTFPDTAGTVTYDVPNLTATFTPSAPLALGTPYTATITTGAQDLQGNGLAADFSWSFTTSVSACLAPVPMASAGAFEVLGGSTVTNTGATVISGGDLGLSPGSAVTGFPPGTLISPAVMHVTDATAAQAQLDLTAAYNYAASVPGAAVLPADLGGLTFTPGAYKNAGAVTVLAESVILDGQGNANAAFIFQIGSSLITSGATQVVLINGASAQNVFWQVGSSATLGVNSVFEGNIFAFQSITLETGASLTGRALARNGAVTLDTNVVTAPLVGGP